MLNLVTVCTDKYPMIYPEKLHRHFKKISNLDVKHYCLTDRPEAVEPWATPLKLFKKSVGWWNKVNLFSGDMPDGYILYMDLDIVILNNFDAEIIAVLETGKDMSCVSDAIGWMGERFSSSLMLFRSGSQTHIFEKFLNSGDELIHRPGGDQVWVGPQLSSVSYIDETFPDLKKNFKFHLAKIDGNNLTLPTELPSNVKLVDCGGKPKPHQLAMLPYIKQNWHDVPALSSPLQNKS